MRTQEAVITLTKKQMSSLFRHVKGFGDETEVVMVASTITYADGSEFHTLCLADEDADDIFEQVIPSHIAWIGR